MRKVGNKKRKVLMICLGVALGIGVLGIAAVTGINLWVTGSVQKNILQEADAATLQDVDCIVVFG